MAERDGKPGSDRADYLSDFPEEFEQPPAGPPRDQARRTRTAATASNAALARIEAMKKKVESLARPQPPAERDEDGG